MEKKFREQQGQYQQENSNQGKVGETVIDSKPQPPKESNKSVGEYVDYEDVNE